MMHTYLGTFTIYDGEHEHTGHVLVRATTSAEADKRLLAMEHDATLAEAVCDAHPWDYGDGTTRSRLKGQRRLTKLEAVIVRRLGLAYYY